MKPHTTWVTTLRDGCLAGALLSLSLSSMAQTASPVTAAAPAAPAALIPAEAFFQNPDVMSASLSPDGNKLAITSAKGGGRVGLAVVDLLTQKMARVVELRGMDIVNVDWVNNERMVFKAFDLAQGSGRRTEGSGLYSVRADGTEYRQLIGTHGQSNINFQDLKQTSLHGNHVLMSVPKRAPGVESDEVMVGELDRRDVTPMWLNTRTGRTRAIHVNAPAGAKGWLFDSAGEPRVVITMEDSKFESIFWRGPAQTEWKLLVKAESLKMPFSPRFVDDAGGLYVTHNTGPEDLAVLSRFDFATGKPSPKPWVQLEGFDFRGRVITDRPGAGALGVRLAGDAETTVWLNESMKRMQERADTRFPGRVNRLECSRCGEADMVVLVTSYSDREPGQIWVYRQATDQWKAVSRVMSAINANEMASVDFQRIKARDGRDLPVWLTVPANYKTGTPLSAVVMVHGGPWVRGGSWKWDAMNQFLASRGYLVISPEFRGSTGYGDAHFKAGFKQWGKAMQDDVADAVLWAQSKGYADKRVCIAGASYGGYATLMGLVNNPELYRCGVAWVGVADLLLTVDGSLFVWDDASGEQRKYGIKKMIGDSSTELDALKAVSPIEQASRIRAPVLLAYGEDDRRVPIAHGNRMRAALQKAGNDPEWITYPGEGHGWLMVKNRVDFAQRVEKFLDKNIGVAAKAP